MKEQILYYNERAKEYDKIYQKPERQKDLAKLKQTVSFEFAGAQVLEVACGTGYWTEIMAQKASSILATDINQSVLEIAKGRKYAHCPVRFEQKDMNTIQSQSGSFDALFGGFIWSHILKESLQDFLQLCLQQVRPGGKLIFIDNNFVAGSNTPINRTDTQGNTFQLRKLESGTTFEVIKNFPISSELKSMVTNLGHGFEYQDLTYYWLMKITKQTKAER